jgi:membrane peptidoglycan carboxypeptidase
VDSIENEDEEDKALLEKFRIKNAVTKISKQYFDIVKDGMHDVTIIGTAAFIKVPGVEYCAKTGTAQNPHGKNHSLFVCFAPKDDPKIAVAVVVENAGFGATWAGPIAGLMMEKYINDTLTKESQLKADNLSQVDLMPAAIKAWYVRNNRNDLLTPLEYSNDELSDVWDMEMLSEITPVSKVTPKIDTAAIQKDSPTAPIPIPRPAIKKDSALNPVEKKKKSKNLVVKKNIKVKKAIKKKNVQQPKQ